MKRRDLLKLGAQKAAEVALEVAGQAATLRADGWIRPPFAVDEPLFLARCTRCDKCLEACGYDVLFKLRSGHGLTAAGTPAMNLLHRGCRLCPDWPCVSACEPAALALPAGAKENAPVVPPKLAVASIDERSCLPYLGPECGACADSCPVAGALQWPDGRKPVIDQDLCAGCALCREACIVDPKAVGIAVFIAAGESGEA
ncbi:MAG TPA: hypothetical protein QGF63_00140 [Alphaproteobacteria bacterium]|jgi:ferredoxin-type protein NapG|nr:hypothetical protein [Alphaproteobacteria bacterium]MDP6271885.1 hypothetical protein [Alphaproteobacteria bacterium]MDP7426966.1 hypothetical protein [Alphaproteobacteria bacterium]HJM48234.1 hypothetical protein [Alphaproteobacteria bacterium]